MKRKYALIAGIALVIMAVVAAFSFGYVHGSIVVGKDPQATYLNLLASRQLFLGGIAGWMVIFISDVVVAWALYYFFREVRKSLSMATAWIRVIYAAILGIAIYNLIAVLPLVTLKGDSQPADLSAVMDHLALFESIWSAGLIIFGIHLLGLGYLSVRSRFVPRIFGWLLLFAGAGYFLLNLVKTFTAGNETLVASVEMVLSAPMAVAEIGFALWLIIRGGKARPRRQ